MAGRDFFVYSAEFLPLGALATISVNVPIQADSDFQLTEITGDVRVNATDEVVVAAPDMLLSLIDQGTGRQLQDRGQQWPNIVGTAQRPMILPMPKEIRANSVIQVTLANLVNAARTVRIAFIGYKIFP
jgi:hypothetical protein